MFNFNQEEVLKNYLNEKLVLEYARALNSSSIFKVSHFEKDSQFFSMLGRFYVRANRKVKRVAYKGFLPNRKPVDPFLVEEEDWYFLNLHIPTLKVFLDGKKKGRGVYLKIRWKNGQFSAEKIKAVPDYISDDTLVVLRKISKGAYEEAVFLGDPSDKKKAEKNPNEKHFASWVNNLFTSSKFTLAQKSKIAELIMQEKDFFEVVA